jgi:hypothetical protein
MLERKKLIKVLMSTPPGKTQVKMYLPTDQVEDLERLAETHGRRSKQIIIEELIRFYLPVWKNVDSNLKQAVGRQMEEFANTYDVAEVQDFDKKKVA